MSAGLAPACLSSRNKPQPQPPPPLQQPHGWHAWLARLTSAPPLPSPHKRRRERELQEETAAIALVAAQLRPGAAGPPPACLPEPSIPGWAECAALGAA